MSSPVQNLDDLKIPLEDILEATNHFSDENFIRQGGFGKIYKGTLLRSGEMIDIVARRLDTKYGQGTKEFWTEISMLSSLKHENLVSIVGFCDEKNEKIVINKYEAKGSLDNYLSDPSLTWLQRLQICVGVARALSYIHYDEKRDFSIIHRNIKSSKILLDGNYEPKLAGFNLSMTTVASRRDRLCIEDVCGSTGYFDPTYAKTGTVTHKSDIYSFGVVLFEVLTGMKAITDNRDIKLAKEAKSRYENKKLDDWINPDLRKQMDGELLKYFSKIAYDCLKEHRAGRPSIHQFINDLEFVLLHQRYVTETALLMEQSHASNSVKQTLLKKYKPLNLDAASLLEAHEFELVQFEVFKRRLAKDDFLDRYFQESQEEKNNLQISLADIKLATQDFNNDNRIGKGGFGQVYKGKLLSAHGHKFIAAKRLDLTSDQGETELMTELVILSEYKHMNVIDLVSYCNENGEKVIVYDYASKGSLDRWLKNKELTWRKRLEICIDIARGLDFLHGTSGVKQDVVIHRDIKSANILLHDDWSASIADFGLSLISPINRDIDYVIDNAKGTPGYCDPLYITTKILTKESDIYSFGVLLFEMLCGRFVMEDNSSRTQNLVHLVKHHFEEGTLYEMVFEATKKQMVPIWSLTIFQNIAYQCIHEERSKRPTAYDVLIQLRRALEVQKIMDRYNISLDNIMLATQDFSHDHLIEKGDFWSVYKGWVTHAIYGYKILALIRLDSQEDTELMTEVEILLEYEHDNVIALLGYCHEKGENILVYEYTSRGSLDRWLKYDALTWRKRLEICIDIARGLAFLHGTSGAKQEVVIHGDIKSANVLLKDDWKAKIANFGQSIIRPIYKEIKVVNNAKGTPGYCYPVYMSTGLLTKESDIYSFGVLLFEMLCGRSVMEHNSSKAQNLVHMVRCHFEEGKLSEMVFEAAKKQIVPESLITFQNIAYKCILEEKAKRPTASDVLIQLNKALEFQEEIEIWEPKLPRDLGKIIRMTYSPKKYYAMSNKEICTSLDNGLLLRKNRVWFSLKTDGRRVEVIPATEFQYFKSYFGRDNLLDHVESRFGQVARISDSSKMNIELKIMAHLLSPGVIFGVNLLFKFCDPRENLDTCIDLKYQIGNKFLSSHSTTERDDGWLMKELFQFSSLAEDAYIDVFLLGFSESHFKNKAIFVEGIEFRAINNMTNEEMEELKRVSMANGKQSPTDEGHWKVNMDEVQELPAEEGGHVLRILLWLLEKCCG